MNNKRKTIISIFILGILSSIVHATGIYHIGSDGGGLFMDTDQDGSWYIDPIHRKDFSLGETGRYSVRADSKGTFIITEKGIKYYIDRKAQQQWENEFQTINESRRQKPNVETKVNFLNGNHVLIPVILGNGRNETKVTMLLDTGASITVIHRDIAEKLNLKSISMAKLMIAGGQLIDSKIVKLDYVDVGPIKKKRLEACVIEHSGDQPPYQGLLGMNFLKGLNYRIDYEREMMIWKP